MVWEVFSLLPGNRRLETGVDCVVPGNRCYLANNEGQANSARTEDSRVLIEHLHLFSSG